MTWVSVTHRWAFRCPQFSLRGLEKKECCSVGKMGVCLSVETSGETAAGKELDHPKFKTL